MIRTLRLAALAMLAQLAAGCVVATVVETTVDVADAVVGTTVDAATGAVDLVVPDGDEED